MHTINSDTLKYLRKRRGWSLDDLASASKVNRSTISRAERGATKHHARHTVTMLATTLGCTAEDLASPPPDSEENGDLLDTIWPRSSPRLKMSDAAQNALHLVAMRYSVSPEEVLDFAPLLFDLIAMESLIQRRGKLKELNEKIAELQGMASEFPHLSNELTGRWDDSEEIEYVEDKSIRSLDIRGLLIEMNDGVVDPRPDYTDLECTNPFMQFLRARATQIAEAASGWKAEPDEWSLSSPSYRICNDVAADFAGGDELATEGILEGRVKIVDLPASLRARERTAERLEWIREQIKTNRKRSNEKLKQLLPDFPVDDFDDEEEG